MTRTKSYSRYKGGPMKVLEPTHEPLELNFLFDGKQECTRIRFTCALNFRRVQVHDVINGWLLGSFSKREFGGWTFSNPGYPNWIAVNDLVRLLEVVVDHFNEGWICY